MLFPKIGGAGTGKAGNAAPSFLPGSLLSMLSHMVHSVRIEVVIISVKGGKAHTNADARTQDCN